MSSLTQDERNEIRSMLTDALLVVISAMDTVVESDEQELHDKLADAVIAVGDAVKHLVALPEGEEKEA